MPHPKPEGGAWIALESVPIPIPWIAGATATFDLIRCVDLMGVAYDDLMTDIIAEEERVQALQRTLPPDAPREARADLDTAYEANLTKGALRLLMETRCAVHGVNPAPVPGKPETWAHLHPALLRWLAYQGVGEARRQLQSPLAQLRPPR